MIIPDQTMLFYLLFRLGPVTKDYTFQISRNKISRETGQKFFVPGRDGTETGRENLAFILTSYLANV